MSPVRAAETWTRRSGTDCSGLRILTSARHGFGRGVGRHAGAGAKRLRLEHRLAGDLPQQAQQRQRRAGVAELKPAQAIHRLRTPEREVGDDGGKRPPPAPILLRPDDRDVGDGVQGIADGDIRGRAIRDEHHGLGGAAGVRRRGKALHRGCSTVSKYSGAFARRAAPNEGSLDRMS